MTGRSDGLLTWTPRVLGVLVCAFLSLFALDAFSGGKSLVEALPDFLIHIAPMALLPAATAREPSTVPVHLRPLPQSPQLW